MLRTFSITTRYSFRDRNHSTRAFVTQPAVGVFVGAVLPRFVRIEVTGAVRNASADSSQPFLWSYTSLVVQFGAQRTLTEASIHSLVDRSGHKTVHFEYGWTGWRHSHVPAEEPRTGQSLVSPCGHR